MLKDFKDFVLRGNVVDLAVGIVVGTAFGVVVKSFVSNLLTPLVSIPGKANFQSLHFTINHSTFGYGTFLNDLISFLIVATAIFFFVVRPINALVARRRRGQETEPDTRNCPECLSEVPAAARRCAFCTSPLDSAA
ncbi:MAG TPA: large conductance mechanosensitive channel protein MscL [Acidimicrobiales bacterium]|nr:large conductance mechanosensitive channel protein MscL [Acidimicrobiales bacterium]